MAANFSAANFSILFGDGAGGFAGATTFAMGTSPISIAVGDFNGDGRLDVVTANYGSNNVTVRLGNGAGSFGGPLNFPGGSLPRKVVAGDLNGDGKLDLTISDNGGGMTVLMGNGAGGFLAATPVAPSIACWSHALGDLNGDGKLDAVLVESPNRVWVLLGNGDGSFGAPTLYVTGSTPYSVTLGDFNGDGKLDVATANVASSDISVLMGNGLGGLSAPVSYPAGSELVSVSTADLNGDGRLDLIGVNAHPVTGGLSVLLGLPGGAFQSAFTLNTGPTPNEVGIADINADGLPDLVSANTTAPGTVSVLRQRLAEPRFVAQPQPVSVVVGSPATFSVNIASALFPTYQWRRNGVNLVDGGAISGATSATLTINPTTLADNGGAYDCQVFNAVGLSLSNPAGLAVTAPATIFNDSCSSPRPIYNGVAMTFSTAGATTDGPTEANLGFCCGDLQVNQDLWFLYTAPSSGVARVTLCGSNYDSKVAIYHGTACPSGPNTAIGGNDDSCGVQSVADFTCVLGEQYLIRVGGFQDAVGNVNMLVTSPVVCPADFNNDGIIDIFDYLDFVSAFSVGC